MYTLTNFRTAVLTIALILLTGAIATFQSNAQVPTVKIGQYGSNVVGVATFDPTDMPYRSVLAATASGELHEIFFGPTTPQQHGDSILGYFSGITAIAGFFAPDDQNRVALVGTQDGNLTEIFYHPYKGKGRSVIASFPGKRIISLTAFYNTPDHHRVVYVALSDSSIWEVNYYPSAGIKKSLQYQYGAGGLGNVVAIAANLSPNGQERRLLVSTTVGYLFEYKLKNQPSLQVTSFNTLVGRSVNPLTSLSTNGYFTVAAAPRLGAGFIYGGRFNQVLQPGVGFVAAEAAGRNFNNFVWSSGSAVYTSDYRVL